MWKSHYFLLPSAFHLQCLIIVQTQMTHRTFGNGNFLSGIHFFLHLMFLVLEPINVLTLQLENNSIDIQNYWGMTKINVFTCMCCYTSLVSDYCNPNVSMFSVFFNQLSQIKVMHIKIEKKVNVSPFRPFHHN